MNIATLVAPIDSAQLAGFVARLDEVNAIADSAPGFRWRLQDESGSATALRPWQADVIVNLSVWASVAALRDYVYGAAHADVLRQRRAWFAPMTTPHLVLWWVPAGHRPTLDEAGERLGLLQRQGPSPEAFTLRQPYEQPMIAQP